MTVWENFLKIEGWGSSYISVDRALRHYARRVKSERTRENFCITLMSFFKYCGLDPDAVVSLDPDAVSKLCQDYTDYLKENDYSIRYVNVTQAYLKTFFRENGFSGGRELKVERYYQPARYRKKPEYIPVSEEIYRMGYAAGSLKNRSMIFMLYTGGLRNSTLRAITYGDVKDELSSGLNIVKINVYPEMKKIDSGACKGNNPYYTFIDSEAVKALREYLKERIRLFGDIAEKELLFYSDSNQVPSEEQRNTPVSKNGLARMVKRAAKRTGILGWKDVTPHGLRKAFELALRNNRLDSEDQEFLMGHILPWTKDTYYDKTKNEEMRTKYARVVFFPHSSIDMEKAKTEAAFVTARMLGLSEEKINAVREAVMKIGNPTADKVIEMLREGSTDFRSSVTIRNPAYEKKRAMPQLNHIEKPFQSKIIKEKELVSFTKDGWEIVRELSNKRFLVKKPNYAATS